MKIKLTWRIWLWIIIFLFSLISIFITPQFGQKGVLVSDVPKNSSAFEQGLRAGDVITEIDDQLITSLDDFSKVLELKANITNKTKTTITTTTSQYILFSTSPLNFSVSKLPKTNLNLGLDLSGGSRAMVQAKNHTLTSAEANDLVDIMKNRFNAYGVLEMNINPVRDLSGNYFVLIEIARATPKDLENLISQQGKFEAKIGNQTVFIGGERDVTDVARSGSESGIYSCTQISGGYSCEFRFTIYLSQAAAERQAEVTANISVNSSSQGNYLSEKLDLYLDDNLVNSLLISESLKGRAETQIQISGSGSGATKDDAYVAAQEEMKNLQTILITGSLPFQLEIVKLDTISPTLGNSFSKYLLLAGAVALLLVAIIIFLRYRTKSAIAPLIICTSEIIITLGIAAFMKWDLDLPSIAGILAAIGTGVDDQIVMLDEAKHKEESLGMKQRLKRAFVIVMGAYFTSVVSLLPLWWAGAGLLKGFVFTTVVGITLGVLVTRPAFADLIKIFEKDDSS